MIFNISGSIKPTNKVLLVNKDKVVIGSGSDIERAFQIGNFMNMLYSNIESVDSTMTNKVVIHNLKVEISMLNEFCNISTEDLFALIDSISEKVELLEKQTKLYTKLTFERSREITASLINDLRQKTYDQYFDIVKMIVNTYDGYYEYI